jgi:hypothetical protein
MYNALEILKALKSNPNAMLWINSERKEAAYHDGDIFCSPVDYQTAMLVRPDPSLFIIDKTDGETLSSHPSIFKVDATGVDLLAAKEQSKYADDWCQACEDGTCPDLSPLAEDAA